MKLAETLERSTCRRIVAAGSCAEYSSSDRPLSEESPTAPASPYAAAKLRAFHALCDNASGRGLQVAWARLFYLYGPGEDPRRLVPYVITRLLRGEIAALSTGAQVRDYLHVDDAASALVTIAEGGLSGAVNVGSGRPTTVRDVAEKIGALTGRSELLKFGLRAQRSNEPPFVCADITRLASATGWKPQWEIDRGLSALIECSTRCGRRSEPVA